MPKTAPTPHTARRAAGALPPPTLRPAQATLPGRLTAAQRRELEAELRHELAVLERRLAHERGMDATGVVESTSTHPADVRTSDTAAQHEAVVAALARLDSHQYGLCDGCGAPIPYGRLLVMPEATRCLACGVRG